MAQGSRKPPWGEYLIEAFGLASFMISACSFGVLLFHPASTVVMAVPDLLPRRFLMGCAMGATAVALIYSPWGRRSGAHFNPAVTLGFFRLGRVAPRDLLAYAAAQFIGGILGVFVATLVLGPLLSDPSVHYVVTRPGRWGASAAFFAELLITFVLFSVVLRLANHPRWTRFTGWAAGLLVAAYITIEEPVSGMSMNPARSLGSAVSAMDWNALWVYFSAPPAGILLAAEVFLRRRGSDDPFCAKMVHDTSYRCIFCETARERARTSL
jgi:aquaporin Z